LRSWHSADHPRQQNYPAMKANTRSERLATER
jgi:hypothetical protein